MPEDERPPAPDHLTLLACGEVEILGRLPWSSNRTYLANCTMDGCELAGVYKPGRGERPLWDFGDNLWRREVAAYELSASGGWNLVPETVARAEGPLGPGSMQRFVPSHFEQHYFTMLDEEKHYDELRTICAFDVVANNADRKSGHCLAGEDGVIWAIDNGLCFHRDPKLRTVIWEFAGDDLPEKHLQPLRKPPTAYRKACVHYLPATRSKQSVAEQKGSSKRERCRTFPQTAPAIPGPSSEGVSLILCWLILAG